MAANYERCRKRKIKELKTMKQWLEKIIELKKELCEIQNFDDDLKTCMGNIDTVHIYNNIEKLAEAVGEELKTKIIDDAEYPIEKYFFYKNMKVFQIETKEGKQ